MADDKLSRDFNAGKNPVSASEFDRAIFNQDVDRLHELIAALKMPREQKADFLTTELRKACALVYHGTINVGIIDALIDAGGKVNQPQGHEASPFGIICQSDDVTVLRHPTTGSVQRVALGGGTVKPVINAGDGGKSDSSLMVHLSLLHDLSQRNTLA